MAENLKIEVQRQGKNAAWWGDGSGYGRGKTSGFTTFTGWPAAKARIWSTAAPNSAYSRFPSSRMRGSRRSSGTGVMRPGPKARSDAPASPSAGSPCCARIASAGYKTTVTMTFEPLEDGRTLVSIAEEGWRETEAGLKASYGNCQGWTQMLCSLKAYLEYGINLREGMFK